MTPTKEFRFPDDAPMYFVICGGCGKPTGGGGFLIDGWTIEKAKAEHLRYSICGECDAKLSEVGGTVRVLDTPDSIKGKTMQGFDPFGETP